MSGTSLTTLLSWTGSLGRAFCPGGAKAWHDLPRGPAWGALLLSVPKLSEQGSHRTL